MDPEKAVVWLRPTATPLRDETRLGEGGVETWRPKRLVFRRLRRLVAWRAWRSSLRLGGVVGAVVFLTLSALHSSVSVYLPPDGAHYIADADALIGQGVRPLLHPPAFPALVASARPVVGDIAAFQIAIGISLGLLVVALYVLLRRWTSPGPSLLGAACGVLMPTTAELLGWGGGATLLATALLVFSLAAMEAWIGGRRRFGIAIGLTLGLTALSHPFVFVVAAFCLGVRWALLLAQRRRLGLGWDPLGLKGIASVIAPLVPALLVAAPYYLGVEGGGGFVPRVPRLAGVSELLGWALRSEPLPWALVAACVIAPIAFRHRGPVTYVGCIVALGLVLATSLEANISYISRVAYLFPVAVAIGIGTAAERIREAFGRLAPRLPRPRAFAVGLACALVGGLALSSYAPRLEGAAAFYQLLEPEDLRALRELRDGTGVVATSWHATEYGSGVSTSWFVEGLAKRRAFGPTAPWLSTVREQREAGLDMQRFFAGTEGIENGALQVAAAPPGVRADPAVQVWSEGFYFPVLYSNSLVNTYPVVLAGESLREVEGDAITWTFRDGSGKPVLRQTSELDASGITIRYELDTREPPGDWSVWFWPAYGVRWKDVRSGPGVVEASQGLPDEDVGLRIAADGGEVLYHPVEPRFATEAIQVRATGSTSLTVRLEFDMQARPGAVHGFTEEEIIERRDISDVVVWTDTGWRDRFDRDGCYALRRESSSLLVYRVLPGVCGSYGDG